MLKSIENNGIVSRVSMYEHDSVMRIIVEIHRIETK